MKPKLLPPLTTIFCLLLVLLLFFLLPTTKDTASFAQQPTGPSEWLLADSPWPTDQHDYQRTAQSPYVGITDGAHIAWYRALHTGGFPAQLSMPDNNRLFAKINSGGFMLDLDGNILNTGYPGGLCSSTPTHLNNGNIYYGSWFSWFGLENNGNVLWEIVWSTGCFHFTTATRADGVGYFRRSNYIFALDLLTGTPQWIQEVPGDNFALGFDETLYVAGFNLSAVNTDGSFQWVVDVISEGSALKLGLFGLI